MLLPFFLSETSYDFPPVEMANKDGLLAIGGDLAIERILTAYKQGIFPWYSKDTPILWWSPPLRMCFYPDTIHISKSLLRILKNHSFEITINKNFQEVLQHCANTPRKGQEDTWILPEMQKAYIELHKQGYAHSIEAWQGGKLVGGLYGVCLHRCFFGESMFSHVSNASKVCLALLGKMLTQKQYRIIDCQMYTSHLASMGAKEIDKFSFITILKKAIQECPEKDNWEERQLYW